ncbi:hypothetical protein ACGFMM_30090 [Streptomyces sp. NPDC048604]|uniref:hypothetical protein n=1 Tax=Streptomyces sp. NPDC048604 TaxID=3365578 RepID=UPI00371E487E
MSATGELVLASRWDAVFDVGHWIAAGLRIAFGSLPEWAKLTFAAVVVLALLGGWAHSRTRRRRLLAASGSDEARVR